MFEISVRREFSAAHRLVDYPGNCSRYHGHNWAVTAHLQGAELNHLGMAMDFREVKRHLGDVLDALDHSDLNQLPDLTASNPTSEVIARYVYRELTARLGDGDIQVVRVDVSETPNTVASYFE